MTAYENALAWLDSFINYERKMTETYAENKMDPARPGTLLSLLNNPHQDYPTLHIAGTKGKGSVAALCASALQASGLRVGLFTSPHLQDFRERFRVVTPTDPAGLITPSELANCINTLKQITPHVPGVTWFELIVALAFLHFSRQQVDIAVIEVGLGGRLDATNVITPLVSVITNLDLEHTALLGNTLREIASEKGGIIKHRIPVVSAPQKPQALQKLQEIATEKEAPLTIVANDWIQNSQFQPPNQQTFTLNAPASVLRPLSNNPIPAGTTIPLALLGQHQIENATVALTALTHVQPHFPTLTLPTIQTGFAQVNWPGRLQTLHQHPHTPTLLLDVAHTPGSAQRLAQALQTYYHYHKLWLIIGMMGEKDTQGIFAPLLPLTSGIIVTAVDHPRAARPGTLIPYTQNIPTHQAPHVGLALQKAWQLAQPQDLICVTGSLYLVGDLLNKWESLQSSLPTHQHTTGKTHNER